METGRIQKLMNEADVYRQAIEDAKMEKLTDLLRSSNLPIAKACALAGFRNHQRAKYVFKSRFGISMRDYRKQQIGQRPVWSIK